MSFAGLTLAIQDQLILLQKLIHKNKKSSYKNLNFRKNLIDEKTDHILFEDESMIRDYQAITKTWFERGKQCIIPTYGKHKGVKLLGALNYETGRVYCTEEENYDAEAFLKFLQKVLNLYPTGKIVMILDNARIHHAKLLESFLQDNNDRFQLTFLPPYSPKLNLIEGL